MTGYDDIYGDLYVGGTATSVKVDWNRDGDFGDTGDDVSSRVRGGLSCQYGRDQSTALAPTVAGSGGFSLDNRSRDYSPRNSSSPLYGYLKPARPVLITRDIDGTVYTLFRGHTDDSAINPDANAKTVTFSLVDYLADFRGQTVATPLYSGIRTGQAIGYILDECGWTGARDIDPGGTIIRWWWEDGTDALEALEKVVRSEGPPALLTVGADGGIVFRDRHHRLTRTASQTSQATWTGATMNLPFVYDDGWRNIINSGSASVDVRIPLPDADADGQVDSVWNSDFIVDLALSESRTIVLQATDPFYDAITPEADTDYTLVSGSLSSMTLSRTSGASSSVTLTAGGSGAKIDGLQVRATSVPVVYSVQASVSDSTSITDFGKRGIPSDLPWCGPDDAQAVLNSIVLQYKQSLPVLSVSFLIGTNVAAAAALLVRDLSDRVTIIETETALSHDFYIESITHELSSEYDHLITFGLEMCPTVAPTGTDALILDSTVAGHRLDEGKLAY